MAKRIGSIICLLVLSYTVPLYGAIVLDKIVAIVNKDVVTWSEVYKAMEFEIYSESRTVKEEDKRKFFKDNEALFMEMLIDRRLQLQEAAKVGIVVGESDVTKAVEGIKKKYNMSQEVFERTIKKEGFTMLEYQRNIAEHIAIGRVVDQEVRGKLVVSERDIDQYISQNPELTREGEGYHLSHIFLKKGPDTKAVEDKAYEIFIQLKTGGDFAELARQYSEGPSAKGGGDLGFIKKAEISKDFAKAITTMKAGDVSEPFWTETGMHILRLDEVRSLKTSQELRDTVREKLQEERFAKEFKHWLRGLREKAYIEVKS